MFTKTLIGAGIALAALTTSFAAANAESNGVMDCQPHDWNAFAAAVETRDTEALRAFLSDPEIHNCDLAVTVEILLCDVNPSACLPPPPPPPVVILVRDTPVVAPLFVDGPFPGQGPGQQLGHENDGGDSGDSGDGDDGDAGDAPAASAPSAPSSAPADSAPRSDSFRGGAQ